MRKIILAAGAVLTAILFLAACNKVKDLPFYANGNAVTLSASGTEIAPTPADSLNEVISFAWTNPAYASDSDTYKYVLEIDSTGRNFSDKFTKTVTGALSTSLTGKELNAVLLNYGFTLGSPTVLDVRIISSYGNNNEQYTSNIINLTVSAYGDASALTASESSIVCDINTANQDVITFSWTPSFSGYNGNITYVLQSDSATQNFDTPVETALDAGALSKTLTQSVMNETALTAGIAGGNSGSVEYRIKATTDLGATVYSTPVTVAVKTYFPLLRFYLPGSYQAATNNGANWDPGTAPEFIRDLRTAVFNDMYYMYIYLPANSSFKITQGRSWDVNYGGSGGNLAQGGSDISVSAAGVYRISINRKTMKYDIRAGRMGFVGGGVDAGWEPSKVFPNYQMGAPADNLFVGITNFKSDEWKMIDNDQWNNGSNTVDETRSYGSKSGSGSTMQVNGDNFTPVPAPGIYRVIWDGRNKDDIKYEMSPATEMRVVGNGIQGVNEWDPGTSPQMTYLGNGVWQISLTLIAGKDIKFVAGNAWGAFDYEDNGDNGNGGRNIKWEGGDNFKTPAATGTYTITLDEYTQTLTIE
ncbi:SusE domain-containing protein [Panacibacter sp. DH6]|uniref:SusE domain-containing protein n=1 Tax=Panacibacter microcysteis TaxID=2793269 RepID=A0A931GXS4_9BACT|nr:SusE domain-containing protein [Panacibacter microcysteis]MBG9376469.1 SusE domain-containing protein [Panacibacter microcysteis]